MPEPRCCTDCFGAVRPRQADDGRPLLICDACKLALSPAEAAEAGRQAATLARGEAERKIRAALEQVEAAQRLLGKACAELSPIIGAAPAWARLGKLYDRVHDEWHRTNGMLQAKRGKFTLDETGRRALAKSLRAGEAAQP